MELRSQHFLESVHRLHRVQAGGRQLVGLRAEGCLGRLDGVERVGPVAPQLRGRREQHTSRRAEDRHMLLFIPLVLVTVLGWCIVVPSFDLVTFSSKRGFVAR